MNQIESISVEDFQSHHRSRVDPAPAGQLTVLVGPTDCGKTAAIRALKWLLYNSPQGVDYVRVGAARAVVAAVYADGSRVVRERSRGGVNRYKIVDAGGAEQVFEGFGTAVPLEVREHTGVGAVEIADLTLTLNLSEQLDGPFLGSAVSAGARARVLGKLAGTEEIDVAARALNTDLHRAGQEQTRLAARVADLEAQVAGYAWVDDLAARVAALQGILGQVRAAEERLGRLEALATRLTHVEAETVRCGRAVARWRKLPAAEDRAARVATGMERAASLAGLRNRLALIEVDRAAAGRTAARWAGVEEAAGSYEAATAAHARAERLARLRLAELEITAYWSVTRRTISRHAGVDRAAEVVARAAATIDRGRALVALARRDVAPQIAEGYRAVARWRGLGTAAGALVQAEAAAGRLAAVTSLAARREQNARAAAAAYVTQEAAGTSLAAAVREYNDTLVRLRRCPTCGQSIPATGVRVEEVA